MSDPKDKAKFNAEQVEELANVILELVEEEDYDNAGAALIELFDSANRLDQTLEELIP